MSESIRDTSNTVYRNFIAGANAQYRDAGLSQYQMRIKGDGTVDVPRRPAPRFKSGASAADQAKAGAAPGPTPAPGAGAPIKRSGPAPTVSDLAQGGIDAFKMAWKPVEGAKQYGVWQDGQLIGHVPSPSFAGQLAPGGSGIIQIDAVRADGTRTALTKALRVTRTPDNKITFDVPGATGAATAAQQGAPAPTPAPAPTAPQGATAPAAAAS